MPIRERVVCLMPLLQIELTTEETRGASAASERQLLALLELLVAAGAPCRHFLSEHRSQLLAAASQTPPAGLLVHSSLLLALGLPAWSPASHGRWPVAFQRSARALLLALRGGGPAATVGRRGVHLQIELCHLIVARAALPVSCWLE